MHWEPQHIFNRLRLQILQDQGTEPLRVFFHDPEIKEGFVVALEEAAKIQSREEAERYVQRWLFQRLNARGGRFPTHRMWVIVQSLLQRHAFESSEPVKKPRSNRSHYNIPAVSRSRTSAPRVKRKLTPREPVKRERSKASKYQPGITADLPSFLSPTPSHGRRVVGSKESQSAEQAPSPFVWNVKWIFHRLQLNVLQAEETAHLSDWLRSKENAQLIRSLLEDAGQAATKQAAGTEFLSGMRKHVERRPSSILREILPVLEPIVKKAAQMEEAKANQQAVTHRSVKSTMSSAPKIEHTPPNGCAMLSPKQLLEASPEVSSKSSSSPDTGLQALDSEPPPQMYSKTRSYDALAFKETAMATPIPTELLQPSDDTDLPSSYEEQEAVSHELSGTKEVDQTIKNAIISFEDFTQENTSEHIKPQKAAEEEQKEGPRASTESSIPAISDKKKSDKNLDTSLLKVLSSYSEEMASSLEEVKANQDKKMLLEPTDYATLVFKTVKSIDSSPSVPAVPKAPVTPTPPPEEQPNQQEEPTVLEELFVATDEVLSSKNTPKEPIKAGKSFWHKVFGK